MLIVVRINETRLSSEMGRDVDDWSDRVGMIGIYGRRMNRRGCAFEPVRVGERLNR